MILVVAGMRLAAAAAPLGAQEPVARTGYHYAEGSATASSQEEATRLAKAKALDRIFDEQSKDDLFQSMFLSEYPMSIQTDPPAVTEEAEETLRVTVRVGVDTSAMNLLESTYQAVAIGLLNRAQGLLEDADATVAQAAAAETQLDPRSAYAAYSAARSDLDEITEILTPLGDDGVYSDSGENLSSLNARTSALATKVATGLARIEEIESEVASEQGMTQARETLATLEAQVDEGREVVTDHGRRSPFFDIPEGELRSIEGEITAALDLLAATDDRLGALAESNGSADPFLVDRVEIAHARIEQIVANGERMIREVQAEIRYPRIERQEDEARRQARREAIAAGVTWALLHDSTGYFRVAADLPIVFHEAGSSRVRRPNDWLISTEVAFVPGLWFSTTFERDVLPLPPQPNVAVGGNISQRRLTQHVAIGYAGNWLIGGGFSWDWTARELLIAPDAETEPVETELDTARLLSVYLGKSNIDLQRIDFLAQLSYMLPGESVGRFLPEYHLNAGLDVRLRLPRVLQLEAGAFHRVERKASAEDADFMDTPYTVGFSASVGLRLPLPFTWKIVYEHLYARRLGSEEPLSAIYRGWGFAVEYTL